MKIPDLKKQIHLSVHRQSVILYAKLLAHVSLCLLQLILKKKKKNKKKKKKQKHGYIMSLYKISKASANKSVTVNLHSTFSPNTSYGNQWIKIILATMRCFTLFPVKLFKTNMLKRMILKGIEYGPRQANLCLRAFRHDKF